MNGNAWQWRRDRYGAYEKGAAMDPTGATTGILRVLRGGFWGGSPGNCRWAHRNRGIPDDRYGVYGIRVAAVAASVE